MVDKEFLFLPSFYKDKNGKVRKVKYDDRKSPSENSRAARLNRILDISRAVLTSPEMAEDINSSGNFDGIKAANKLIEVLNATLYDETLIDRLVDIAVKNDPELAKKYGGPDGRITSISDWNLICKEILKLDSEDLDSLLESTKVERNPLSASTFAYYHRQNMAGAILIGIFANNTTLQAKFQQSRLQLKDDYAFTMDGREVKDLSAIYTEETVNGKTIKKKISKICAEYSAASVDNAKDPQLDKMNQTKNSAFLTCFLLRAGFTNQQIGLIFSNPLVKSFIEQTGGLKYVRGIGSFRDYVGAMYYRLTGAKINPKMTAKELKSENLVRQILYGDIVGTSLMELRERYGDDLITDSINDLFSTALQIANMIEIAQELQQYSMTCKPDSPNNALGVSIAEAKTQVLAVDRIAARAEFKDYPFEFTGDAIKNNVVDFQNDSIDTIREKLMKARMPMLQAFYTLGIEAGTKIDDKYFYQSNPFVNECIDQLTKYSANNILSARTINTLYKELVTSELTSTDLFGKNLKEKKVYYLRDFPSKFLEVLKNNPDIASLGIMQKMYVANNTIFLRDANKVSGRLEDMYMRDFETLLYMDNPAAQQLAIDLYSYAYYKDGFYFGPKSFGRFFSTVFQNSVPEVVNALRDMEEIGSQNARTINFMKQFIAQHFESLFPRIGVPGTSIDGETLEFESKNVKNRNIRGAGAYRFICVGNNLFTVVNSTQFNDKVRYTRVNVPRSLTAIHYNTRLSYNDWLKECDYISKNLTIVRTQTQTQQAVQTPSAQIANSQVATPDEVLQQQMDAIESLLEGFNIEEAFEQSGVILDTPNVEDLKEYDPNQGLEENDINRC